MKINVRRCDAKERLINGGFWHRWFAWHPVKIGHEWVWLTTVIRKRVWWFCFAGCGYDSFYKLPNAPAHLPPASGGKVPPVVGALNHTTKGE